RACTLRRRRSPFEHHPPLLACSSTPPSRADAHGRGGYRRERRIERRIQNMTYADQLDRRDFLKKAAVAGTATAGLGWLTYADLQHEAVAKGRHCKWGALSLKG